MEPDDMGVAALELQQQGKAGVLRHVALPPVIAGQQLLHGHGGIPHDDDLVVRGDVVHYPLGEDGVPPVQGGVQIEALAGGIVEVVHLQVLEAARLADGLEKKTAELPVVVHGAAGVHKEHQLQGVLPGTGELDGEVSRIVAGLADGGVNIQLGLGLIGVGGELPEAAEGHLELAGVDGVVLAPVPVLPLAGHPVGGVVTGLSAHPDAAQLLAPVSEGGVALGAHPFAAAVVLSILAPEALGKHTLDLLHAEACDLRETLQLHEVQLRVLQPLQHLRRDLVHVLHVLEELQKHLVKAVEIRLAVQQHGAAEGIEA